MGSYSALRLLVISFVLTSLLLPGALFAADPSPSQDERDAVRAEDNRTRSIFNSQRDLGYRNIYQDSRDRSVDYRSLSDQIHRLADLIRELEQEEPRQGEAG